MENQRMISRLLDLEVTEEDAIDLFDQLYHSHAQMEELNDPTYGYRFIHSDFRDDLLLSEITQRESNVDFKTFKSLVSWTNGVSKSIAEVFMIFQTKDYAHYFSCDNSEIYIGKGWYAYKL